MAGVDIECPRCKARFGVHRTELAPGKVIPCPHCGHPIVFTAEDLQALMEFRERVGRDEK